jgi:membrane-bound lytic murein transglycosylase D
VAPQEIASWNNISLKSALLPGKKITIKATTQQLASSNTPHLMNYTVVKNDSLEQISKKFKVSVADLRKANPTVLAKGLNPGQRLKVLIDSTPYSG